MGKYSDPNNPCANLRPNGQQCSHFVGNHAWDKDESDRGMCQVELDGGICGCPEYIDSAPKAASKKSEKADPVTKPEKPDTKN